MRGTVAVLGSALPNGKAVLTRSSPRERPYNLRGGKFDVTTGTFIKEDSEASFGIPLRYTLDMTLSDADRLIQRNLALTPSFLHGMQSWAPGLDRSSSVISDPTAFNPQVGWFSKNPGGVSTVDAPSVVGHIESSTPATGNYTLTPSGTVAAADLMYLVHTQSAQYPEPVVSGFTLVASRTAVDNVPASTTGLYPGPSTYPSASLFPGGGSSQGTAGTPLPTAVRLTVWSRIRVAGDDGYAVVNAAGAETMASLLWIRNVSATYTPIISEFGVIAPPSQSADIIVPGVTVARPAINLTLVASHSSAPDVYITGSVSGNTKLYEMSSTVATIPGVGFSTAAERDSWNSYVATQTSQWDNRYAIFGDETDSLIAYQDCSDGALEVLQTGVYTAYPPGNKLGFPSHEKVASWNSNFVAGANSLSDLDQCVVNCRFIIANGYSYTPQAACMNADIIKFCMLVYNGRPQDGLRNLAANYGSAVPKDMQYVLAAAKIEGYDINAYYYTAGCVTSDVAALLQEVRRTGITQAISDSLLDKESKDIATIAAYRQGYTLTGYVRPNKLTRSIVVGAQTLPNAGNTVTDRVSYNRLLSSAVGVQIGLQANISMAPRIVATSRTGLLKASGSQYLMTGRFKYHTSDLWLWQDVKDLGTWAQLKLAKANWGAVRSQSSQVDETYVRLFVSIVAADGSVVYVNPVQVITLADSSANQWLAFNFYFDVPVDIPAGSKIQFFHGTNLREYAIDWQFDRLGITSGEDRATHNVLDWFSGDTTVPYSPEDNLFPSGEWDSGSDDAKISWEGAAGNSVSLYVGPSKVTTSTVCTIEVPDFGPDACEPVYLNDPITPPRGQWYSLMRIDPINYNARQQVLDIINRNPQIVVSQARSWASGSLTIMTRTLPERTLANQTFETGRILLLRNPDPNYPESGWYVAIGTITEARLGNDHRRPERLWTVPFVQVERPSGLIDSAVGQTWAQLKLRGMSWGGVKSNYINWLDILSEQPVGANGFGLGDYIPPASDYALAHTPVDISVSGSAAAYSNTIGILQPKFGGSVQSVSSASGRVTMKNTATGSVLSVSRTNGAFL